MLLKLLKFFGNVSKATHLQFSVTVLDITAFEVNWRWERWCHHLKVTGCFYNATKLIVSFPQLDFLWLGWKSIFTFTFLFFIPVVSFLKHSWSTLARPGRSRLVSHQTGWSGRCCGDLRCHLVSSLSCHSWSDSIELHLCSTCCSLYFINASVSLLHCQIQQREDSS